MKSTVQKFIILGAVFSFAQVDLLHAQPLRPVESAVETFLTHKLGKEFLFSKEGEIAFEKVMGRALRQHNIEFEFKNFISELSKTPNKQELLDSFLAKKLEFKKLPLSSAFPEQFLSLSSEKKFKALEVAYPDAVKLVKDIPTIFRTETGSVVKKELRDILVISLSDLKNHPRKNQFLDTYLKVLSKGLVSFPLASSANHLRLRMGNTSFDYYHSVRTEAFRLPEYTRMEPLLQLSDLEHMNLRRYIENAKGKERDVLGSWNYDGVATANTQGELYKNAALEVKEGHNCTSWIGTAPVGANREKLLELVDATANLEIHTNPGWWNYYLSQGAPRNRVPVVVYWSDLPLAQSVGDVMTNKFFQRWQYNLH